MSRWWLSDPSSRQVTLKECTWNQEFLLPFACQRANNIATIGTLVPYINHVDIMIHDTLKLLLSLSIPVTHWEL